MFEALFTNPEVGILSNDDPALLQKSVIMKLNTPPPPEENTFLVNAL